eukprot:15478157-Alexandrium_andersonii.AAC.1
MAQYCGPRAICIGKAVSSWRRTARGLPLQGGDGDEGEELPRGGCPGRGARRPGGGAPLGDGFREAIGQGLKDLWE